MAGPRGFEPRVSGFGGLRTILVGIVRRLNPGWATDPVSTHPVLFYKLSFVATGVCKETGSRIFLGANERAGLLDLFDLPYVCDDLV